jgi:amino acid adenylation domain-containing protein
MPALLPQLVAATADRVPDAPAVAHDGTTLTYRDLADRSGRIAALLRARGARPGDLVAVAVAPSIDLLATVLAILQIGAGYVPVTTDDPAARLAHVLADAAPVFVVAGPDLRLDAVRVVRLGTSAVEAALAAADPEVASHEVTADDTAYVIYTSGSTGRPKGVEIGHGALAAYLRFAVHAYPGLAGRALLHSSVSYDMAVTSLFGPLVAGGCVEFIDLLGQLDRADPRHASVRPSFLKVTPSHLPLLALLPDDFAPTGELVVGGEALTGAQLRSWRARHPEVTVVNEYGPTEATVGCCVATVAPGAELDDGAVSIGYATEGTRLFVLDPDGVPVPEGTPGELYIAGDQLARGYLHAPDMTAVKFPTLAAHGRVYRTGDLVRRRTDGALEFLGRCDDQIKVNGHRVELGEVEAALTVVDGVHRVAVLPAGEPGKRTLLAYVAATGVGASDLLAAAEAALPAHMVPAAITVLPELPLTSNGKVDRDRLPRPTREGAPDDQGSDDEVLLRMLVQEVTGAESVGMDDDFLAIGGTSIAAAQLVSRARRSGFTFGLLDVLRRRTVRALLTVR